MDEKEDIKNDLEDISGANQDEPKEEKSNPENEGGEVEGDQEEKNQNTNDNEENQVEENNEGDGTVQKSKKLFFCNINRSSDLSTIFKVFRYYGEICDILILKDKNGHSLVRGFVEYVRDMDAEEALARLDNTIVDGLKISIKYATPRVHKTGDVEYKQDPKKLDEDMRRKDYRLRQKNENQSRMPPQQIRNMHRRHHPYRDNPGDYQRSQNDYISDYDPYDYDFDRDSNRRYQRDRDRDYHHDFDRDRDRPPDRSYIRDFDRDRYRDRDRDRDQDMYSSRFHRHGHNQPPIYMQQSSHRPVSSIPVMRSSYRQDIDDRPQSRPRRPNYDDDDFDYDYDRDSHDRRRRIQSQGQSGVMRPSVQMVMPYAPAHVVYQPGRSNSSPAPGSTDSNAPATVVRVVPGQQQMNGSVVAVRRYQDDIRLQPRGQPPSKQLQEEQQRGYWKEDDYEQRGYRRRDRM